MVVAVRYIVDFGCEIGEKASVVLYCLVVG
jgi:hypothetical protein